MPIFNYVREHRRFIRYASDNKLTPSERLLWYALVDVINEESESNVWTDGFIRISNGRLLTLCDPMGEDTLFRARNGLKQRGLIEFKPGNRNKENPAYRVKLFYPDGCPQNAGNTGGNIRGNVWGNTGGNTGGNMPVNMGDIYINQNKGHTGTETKRDLDDDDDDAAVFRACAREDEDDVVTDRPDRENEIVGAYRRAVGRNPYAAEVNKLVWAGYARKMAPVMAARAVEIAAEEGAAKPCQYAVKIMDEWEAAHVLQPEQIDGFRLEEKIRLGKAPFAGTGDGAEDWRRRQEAAEARRQENIRAGLETDWMAKEG